MVMEPGQKVESSFLFCAFIHSQRVRQYLTNLGLGFGSFERQCKKRPAALL
jgi:hypothetical protein